MFQKRYVCILQLNSNTLLLDSLNHTCSLSDDCRYMDFPSMACVGNIKTSDVFGILVNQRLVNIFGHFDACLCAQIDR